MKFGLLKYQKEERNLGDYVQSIAARGFLPKIDTYLSREELDTYSDDKIKMILNGWFMHQPNHWPPSENINPLFVSFHINESVVNILTSEESINYLKKHEPIGCRDMYTRDVLNGKGVDAYFSGCLTLTLDKEKFISKAHACDTIICDPFWTTYSNSEIFSNATLNFFQKLIRIPYYFYKRRSLGKLVRKLIPSCKKETQYFTHFLSENCSTEEKFIKAEEMLKYYANSKLVITGRIHVALPCIAFNTPVLFINPEKDTSRFAGVTDLFNQVTLDELYYLSKEDLQSKYKLDEICNLNKHLVLRNNLIEKCQQFFK